jgi:hypothetical protein
VRDAFDERRGGEGYGRHAGVVHGCDGKAHDDRTENLADVEFVLYGPEAKGQEHRRSRDNDSDENRHADNYGIVVAHRGQAHSGHSDIVHRADGCPHNQAAECYRNHRQFFSADDPKCRGCAEHRREQRQRNRREVIKNWNPELEGQHSDVVHGPDSETHRKSATGEPCKAQISSRGGSAPGKIEGRMSGENGDQDG